MPNRIIKESIRTSRSVNNMTDFEFRLWVHLITYVDDFGRGSADPEILKGFLFPRRKGVTDTQIENVLCKMATAGIILLYEVDGESYLQFPNWEKHQSVRAKVSKFPAPESTCNQTHADENTCNQTHADESTCVQMSPYSESYSESRIQNPEAEAESTRAREESTAASESDGLMIYAANNLQYMSPHAFEELASFREDMPEDMIRHAIDAACDNGARTWAYTRSILNRYMSAGYKSIGDVQAADDKHKAAKHATPRGQPAQREALNYAQREYVPGELEAELQARMDELLAPYIEEVDRDGG